MLSGAGAGTGGYDRRSMPAAFACRRVAPFLTLAFAACATVPVPETAPVLTIRRAADRGHADHGWLDSRHTFSFADYRDPRHMGFRCLRVMNEDRIAPGGGFDMHTHRDMEIVTYVLEGALEHRDSLGNGEILRPGEFQRMSAGTGIDHGEFNPSSTEPVHFYQIWIRPDRAGRAPEYEQKAFDERGRRHRFQLVASPDGADGSLRIGQDARIALATLDPEREVAWMVAPDRFAWIQVLRGVVRIGGAELAAGDGASLAGPAELRIEALAAAEVMAFDLP